MVLTNPSTLGKKEKQKEQVEPPEEWGANGGSPEDDRSSLPIPTLIDQRQWGKIIVANGEK
jgi:hypothetical protein